MEQRRIRIILCHSFSEDNQVYNMLISTPTDGSQQLVNSHPGSNHSLPASFPSSLTSNPCTWSINQVEEWLGRHGLRDCSDLICSQHRMNGQRLMNLKENDVLQLTGTNRNSELWAQIKNLQQFYSSNYHLWTQHPSSSLQNQSALPQTASSCFAPPASKVPVMSRSSHPVVQTQPTPPSLTLPSVSIPLRQTHTSTSSSTSSNSSTFGNITINQHPTSSLIPSTQTATTVLLERSPLTVTRTSNHQQYKRRSSSHSLSPSSTSISILQSSSSQRATNSLLNTHGTPADQIEDQLMTTCFCCIAIRSDRKKTLSAFLLAACTLYFCSFIITIVDERLPDPKLFPPLPDLILDNVKQIPWAFAVTEAIILIEMLTLATLVVFHRHRYASSRGHSTRPILSPLETRNILGRK